MTDQTTATLTLFELLARRWQTESPIAEVRLAGDGIAAFATLGGAVLVAGAPDSEPPDRRIRVTGDLGQTTIRPRRTDPAPLAAVTGLTDGAPPLAATTAGFLTGDADGRVLAVDRDGATEAVLELDGAVAAVDHAAGTTAAADGQTLAIVRSGDVRRLEIPGFRMLAIDPSGRRIAAANAAQVVVLDAADPGGGALLTVELRAATRLAWRDDGRWLAVALGGDGLALVDTGADAAEAVRLRNFPAAVRSLAWSRPADAVVAGGAFRIAAWDAGALPGTGTPLVTGQPGLVVAEAVAAHPERPLVAAGYANGQVILAQVGRRDELLLRQGGPSVSCLAFSADGRHLALGDAGGGAAIATFPQNMFK